jgi:hypothetical protein
MKATFNPTAKTKFNRSSRKEVKCYFDSYSALIPSNYDKQANAVVDLRLYCTGSVWHCAVWINGNGTHTSGTGSAGGYGYDKQSAAASDAIRNAGFTLSENIAGVGSSAIERAVYAIAEAIGHPEAIIFHAHQ